MKRGAISLQKMNVVSTLQHNLVECVNVSYKDYQFRCSTCTCTNAVYRGYCWN